MYALECYSKRNLNGKIPPKHQIKSVLNLALNVENADHKISQPRKHRQNPCKNVLEKHGIVFPESNDTACNADQSALRYMPMTKEENCTFSKRSFDFYQFSREFLCPTTAAHTNSSPYKQQPSNSASTECSILIPLSIAAGILSAQFRSPESLFAVRLYFPQQPVIASHTSTSTITSKECNMTDENNIPKVTEDDNINNAASVLLTLSGNESIDNGTTN